MLKKKQRSGAVVVEFALTAPLLVLLLFGALELSHANMVLHVTEAAAYEGARVGIVPGANSSEVVAAANRLLDISKVHSATVQVVPANLDTSTESIEVQIEVAYSANSMIPPIFTGGLTVQRSCVLARELAD